MRVAVFLPHAHVAHVRAALDDHDELCVAESWDGLEALIRVEPLAVVVFSPAADGTLDVARACKLIRRFSSIPFVAYVPLDAPFARGIAHMSNDGMRDLVVARANDSPGRFREILNDVAGIHELTVVVDALEPRFSQLPATISHVLIDALRQPHKYPSAEAIAASAGVTVSALYRSFRHAQMNPPKSFVVGAHAFRGYLYLKDVGFSIRDIAAKLGYTHPRIFAHQVEAVFGHRPSRIRYSLKLDDAVQRLVVWFSSPHRLNGDGGVHAPISLMDKLLSRASTIVSTLLLALLPRLLGGQVPVEPVDFRPFADGRTWIVKQPMVYRIGVSKDSVVIPEGFVTDMASIPPILQSIIQQNGPYQLPAVVHDYLYWRQDCTREQSDRILLLAMTEHNVSKAHRTAIFDAVRAAGQFAWAANARERAQDLLRVIPADRRNIPSRTYWPEYRAQLMREGATNPTITAVPAKFCRRANMSVHSALTSP